jgi:hypothetical protein
MKIQTIADRYLDRSKLEKVCTRRFGAGNFKICVSDGDEEGYNAGN